MADAPPIVITNEADYRRVKAQWTTAQEEIHRQADAGTINREQMVDRLADIAVPYRRVLTDPANPMATGVATDDYMRSYPDAQLLVPGTNPTIDRIIADETRTLNGDKGQSYAPPRIIVVDGMAQREGTPLLFNQNLDAVLIDREALAAMGNSNELRASLGHELTHRYQRSNEQLRAISASAAETANDMPGDAISNNVRRRMESEADYYGARLGSVDGMQAAFDSGLREELRTNMFRQYEIEKNNLPDLDAAYNYIGTLSPERVRAERSAYYSIDPTERTRLRSDFIRDETRTEPGSDHPSYEHRSQMMQLLRDRPDLLGLKNVQFDGSANIITATETGPPPVPNVAAPQRGPETPPR